MPLELIDLNLMARVIQFVRRRLGVPPEIAPSTVPSPVSACWSKAALQQEQYGMMGWLDSPIVRNEYVLPRLFPDRKSDYWVQEIVDHYNIPWGGHWLGLGCGNGKHEIRCRQVGLCRSADAYDVATEAIRIARADAAAAGVQGINFQVADFQQLDWPSEHYDVVLMAMALHHVADLTGIVLRIKRCLKPGGWLIADEYIGPARFQFPDHQIAIANQLLGLLPEAYRRDYIHQQDKTCYERRPIEFWLQVDPSEAVCSDQIDAVLRYHFGCLHYLPYGGSILNLILEHIVGNFDARRQQDVALIRLLAYIETLLIEHHMLTNDFAIYAAHKV